MASFNIYKIYPIVINIVLCCFYSGAEGGRIKRLVGGEDTNLQETYYQASLQFNGMHICGGTIITSKHILTAAHCVAELFEPPFDELEVAIGTLSLKKGDRYGVFNISWHPDFESGEHEVYNDVAVLTLKNEINVTSEQKPVRLPNFPAPDNAVAVISGWGWTSSNNPYSAPVLKKATVITMNNKECQQFYKVKIENSQICARAESNDVGICKGDSGGPLVVEDTIIGISSWTLSIPSSNIFCNTGAPDVYTDVYYFMKFIKSIIHGH
ncbi:trypsin-6-like [Chelonus insularis]|uniref:trypsin-6-like n=1 Tax=Chelonus insularis TaxID=460826 RepID=UPI001588B293|nr:trypsin-6-like [Chelonus insularis]